MADHATAGLNFNNGGAIERESAAHRADETSPCRQPVSVLISACVISAAAALFSSVLPLLLTAAARKFALDAGQIGLLGSCHLAGFALVAITSNRWLRRFNWRTLVGGGAMTSLAALTACGFASTYYMLLTAAAFDGAGLGVLYTLCVAVISENHRPDRAFGIKLAVEVISGGAVFLLLSGFVIPRWGFSGASFALAALVGTVTLIGLARFPARGLQSPPDERPTIRERGGNFRAMLRNWAPWTGLAGLFISYAGISSLWAFFAELAPTFGIDDRAASSAFMMALGVGGAGGIAAAVIGDRFGRATPLVFGMLLAIVGAAALQWGHGFPAYLVGVVLTVGLANFPMAYQMGMIASADERGDVAVLMPAAMAIGGALGPLIAGGLLSNARNFAPLYALFAGATAAGLALFLVLRRHLGKRAFPGS